MSLATTAVSFVIALFAGAFGSILGIGGGLFIIPSLTLLVGIRLKTAIAASIVAVIATSLAGSSVYLRSHLSDLRLGLALALATVPGAIIGATFATRLSARWLAALFAVMLAASAWEMARAEIRERGERRVNESNNRAGEEPETPDSGGLRVSNYRLGLGISVFAGLLSGLLGVGGGVVQVPVMHTIMKVPLRISSATSTYVIGITASAGAFVYYNHRPSFMDPALSVPVVLGVVIGASFGSRVLGRIPQGFVRTAFVLVLLFYTVQMGLRAVGINLR